MEENVAKFKETLSKSRTETEVSHALYDFQKSIHPYSCTQTGRKQLVGIFKNIWEIFISIIQKYSSSTMVRVATFSVASTFLIRMTPFFPFQIRQSFSSIVSNETFLDTSASLFLMSNSTQNTQEKSDDKTTPTQTISTASNVSVLLAAAFSFITHFISPESIGEFLEESPIFHHFVDRNALESEHLPSIISNICDNVGITWYRSLLFGLLQVNSIHKNWSRGTIKAIYAIIKHNPSILMNDFLQFFLTNNTKNESHELQLDNFELTLVSFFMTSLIDELNDIDFLPFAKLALNIVYNFSKDMESSGTQTQIENAMQILSVKTRSFRLKIVQVSDDSIEMTLFKGRTAFENKSTYRKKIEEDPVYLSNDDIEQILKDFDAKQKSNPKEASIPDDENFGLNDDADDVEINKTLESSSSVLTLLNLSPKSNSIYNFNMSFSQSDPNISPLKSNPVQRINLSSEKFSSEMPSESSEVTLFKSNIPFSCVQNTHHTSNSDNDEESNTVVEKITIKFEPFMKYVSFYLLPLPIDPFLLPKTDGEESCAIFSAKMNAIASYFTDSNRIIDEIHSGPNEDYNDSIDEKTLNRVIALFDRLLPEKYDMKVSAILQALPKCVNCFLMNTKDPKFIGILRRVLFAPITSWFHALEILGVIEAINPDLIEFAFGQRTTISSGLKEIIELILDLSIIQKYNKIIEPCYNIIVKLTTKKNYYHVVDILLEHVDLFNPISIQRHLDIIYELIQQYDNKSHKPRKHYSIIQHHCFKFFEVLDFYVDDVPTISSIFHFLSLYDSSELFLSAEKDEQKINHFKKAIALSKLIVNAGVTYLLGMPKTDDISLFYDKIESIFISQCIEVTYKGVTDYKKQFKCIHAAMCFVFSLPESLVSIEDQFIFDASRRLFRFFPLEVSHFLYSMKPNQNSLDIVRNSLFHDILVRMDAMKDIEIHALWCKIFIKFRSSTKNLDKSSRRIMNSIVFLLRHKLDKLTAHEISDFLNFIFLFDKTSNRFILRTIASIDHVKRLHFFKIASKPVKEMFIAYFQNEIDASNAINYRKDYYLLNKLFKKGSIDHIVKRINKVPQRLQFYKNNLNGWILMFIIRAIDQPKNDKTEEIENEITQLSLNESLSKDSMGSEMKALVFPQLSFSHLNDYVYIWRPFNPYFKNYIKSRKERLSMKLQSGCDDAIQLFLRINNVKSEEMRGLSIQPTALPYVIKHLWKREPDSDFLNNTIIPSLSIDDILTSKKAAVFEAMHINPSIFLQQFQLKPRLKKKQLLFLSSFLASQKIKSIRRKPSKITSKSMQKSSPTETPKQEQKQKEEVRVISSEDSKDSIVLTDKNTNNSLLYALMLRLFEGENKLSRIKCILSLISVLISTSSAIPYFFLRSFNEIIFVDLNRTLSETDQSEIDKLVNLPEEVSLVFSTLGQRQCSTISFDMNDQILQTGLNSIFSIDIDDDIRRYLFTFHRNVQTFNSPSFAEIFLLTYSFDKSNDNPGHRIGMSNSQLSSELETDLRSMLQGLELYPTLPSNIIHASHIFNAISFWPIAMAQRNARGFVKNHYQILFTLSKDQLWNPFIIENILKISLGFLLDNSNGYNTLNTRQFSFNFIRDFIMENFFKPFINEINNNSTGTMFNGCPYLDILLHFLRLICWSPSSNVEMLSLAFSIAEVVPNHVVSYTVFSLYISILKLYLNTIENKESRKLIVLHSINTWIRSLSNSTYCNESYDSFKFMVYYIHLMDKTEIDIDTILQVINEQFEEKFSFFPFFLSFAIYVKYLHSKYHNDQVKFEDSDIGQKMLAILCDASTIKERKRNVQALQALIRGNYKDAFKAMMK